MNYILQVEPAEDEDGEDLGYFEFDLLDGANLKPPWYDGVAVDPGPLPIRLAINDLGGWSTEFADYCSTPVPLASGRLRAALEEAGVTNIHWFPTALEHNDHADAPTYYAMNIIGSVSAADPAKSRSTRLLGVPGADIFDDLTLVEKRVAGLTLFRLAESASTIVVSEFVKNRVESAGIDTVNFMPVASA